jgi:hypothetical protein
MALVAELAALGKAGLAPLDGDEWEVRLSGAARMPVAQVLQTVETWLCVWGARQTTVHLDGRPRTLVARQMGREEAPGV